MKTLKKLICRFLRNEETRYNRIVAMAIDLIALVLILMGEGTASLFFLVATIPLWKSKTNVIGGPLD